jgi:glycosyltransferase involved in cell wall biosynthesis
MRKLHIDLVHTHSDLKKGQPEIFAAKLLKIPCVTHRHGFSNYTRFDKLFGNLVDANIYVSGSVAAHHYKLGEPVLKGTTIHNGVNIRRYNREHDRESVRRELNSNLNEILVGHIARIDWWKGHEIFVEAMSRVIKEKENVKGIIIGGVAELHYKKSLDYLRSVKNLIRELGLENKVILTGHVEDMPRAISGLDLVVNATTTREPFGLTIIEGMAAGKPVIASELGGPKDIIIEGIHGRFVPPKNPTFLAKAIIDIIYDPDKAKMMGKCGKNHVLKNFTSQIQADKVQKVYMSVLKNKK